MSTNEDLLQLFAELKAAGSPLRRMKILGRAWRTLRRLSPKARRDLASQVGIDGAGDVIEQLAARDRRLSPAALLASLEALRSTDPAELRRTLGDLKRPAGRRQLVDRGLDLVASTLAVVPEVAPLAESSESPPAESAAAPARPVAAARATQSMATTPATAAAAGAVAAGAAAAAAKRQRTTPARAQAATRARHKASARGPADPAAASPAAPQHPTVAQPRRTPAGTAVQPAVRPVSQRPATASQQRPVGAPAAGTPRVRPATARPAARPSSRRAAAGAARPTATDPARPRPRPAVQDGLADALADTGSLTRKFHLLRARVDEARALPVEELRQVLDAFPSEWARRRALSWLLDRRIPRDLHQAIDLIEGLESPASRRWCVARILHGWPLTDGEREALLERHGSFVRRAS